MSDTNRILSDIRAYLRISAAAASGASASKIFDNYEKAWVYGKLDGKNSQIKIKQITQVPQKTISNWVELFVQARLASPPDEYNPSHRAMFTLRELGIDVDTLKKRDKKRTKPSSEAMPKTDSEKAGEGQQTTIQNHLEDEKNGTANQ